MTRAQGFGSLAAIGGLTALIALQTGIPTAKADELADLRANQLLLQQRIDQLAQAQAQGIPEQKQSPGFPGAMGSPATPGVALAGGSFPRSFLIPGTDTSIRVGGFVDITILDFLQGGGGVNGSNYGSNSGQNGNLQSIPLGGGVVPGAPGGSHAFGGFVAPSVNRAPGRNNGVLEFSPQQSRINIETRTPTGWGESRTFFEFDWAGCDNFSCQTLQQGGGNSLTPRLRYAYGTLGGFLAGQAISNFSDADADTESMEFGGAEGSTGGYRIPQVRYTLAGPYGSAFSVSAENPFTTAITPGGVQSTDLNLSGTGTSTTPPQGVIGPFCNGVACTGAGGAQANPAVAKAPTLTVASYWSQPWGHVDFSGVARFYQFQDGHYIDQQFSGYGGHISGDVKPGWWGYNKDDFLFSFIAGTGIGNYTSGGDKSLFPIATNFSVATACATPIPGKCTGGMAASNVLFKPIFAYSLNGGYQHWWTPTLRTTIAAGTAQQDVSSQLIGPMQAEAVNKQLWNAFVNLVWNPVAFITTGVEYMYGSRTVVANLRGKENVLIGKFRVAF
ncbi:MAG: DcaP family trimeric outer membrane transporter [Stellaceae bacterium]